MSDVKSLLALTKNLTILYVEDEESTREALSVYLNKLFKAVKIAKNGVEALELYEKTTFDIIITDIQMPKMDGIELCRRVKNINSEQNIIISTAFSDSEYFMDSIKLGVDGYVLKPVDYSILTTTLFKTATKIKKFKEHAKYEREMETLLTQKTSENVLQQMQIANNYEQTLFALIDIIEKRDTYTGKHSLRVANYSVAIAKQMGFSKKERKQLYKAGILHDLGKIAIPDSLLLKPTQLKKLEYDLIKEHVNIGFHMLDKIPMFRDIAKIINSHHERLDGSGYPNGLKEDDIPLFSNIMALADTFDAMTTSRIYKEKKSIKEALEEIKKLSGIHFKPQIVEAALICLKDVQIDSDINQLPKSNLEKERFSYFYKDNLTEVYNEKYLDLILSKNIFEKNYQEINLIIIENFGKYNKKHGWLKGNKLLIKTANKLDTLCGNKLIFRVHGNNFIVLGIDEECKEKLTLKLQEYLDKYEENIKILINSFDIFEKEINSISKLESYL